MKVDYVSWPVNEGLTWEEKLAYIPVERLPKGITARPWSVSNPNGKASFWTSYPDVPCVLFEIACFFVTFAVTSLWH